MWTAARATIASAQTRFLRASPTHGPLRSSAAGPDDAFNCREEGRDANGRDHAQLRTRLRAVRGTAPVGARLLTRFGPPPYHRTSVGPHAVRSARRFTYAHP